MSEVKDYFDFFVDVLSYISLCFITTILFVKVFKTLFQKFQTKSLQLCGGPQVWAVVTGATDGIGLEYAKQLAKKRYNLLLLSRNREKLKRVKSLIESQNDCKVTVLVIDFRFPNIYDQIVVELNKLEEIHILVNNVGMGYPNSRPEYFTNLPSNYLLDLINVNIVACTRLMKLILPRMEENGKGIIINISSGAALYPVPFSAAYSASKAYIDYMSRGLSKEYESKGITIQSVLPFYVSTKLIEGIEQDLFTVSPENFVSSALKTLGKSERTSGHFLHRFQYFVCELFNVLSKNFGFDINIMIATSVQKKLMSASSDSSQVSH